MRGLNQQFDGQAADTFFAAYGRPAGSAEPEGGGKRYRWVSIQDSYPPPEAGPNPSHTFVAHGRSYGFFDPNAAGSVAPHYCEISIHTDAGGIIRRIALVHDDVGKYGNSLCAELLGQ